MDSFKPSPSVPNGFDIGDSQPPAEQDDPAKLASFLHQSGKLSRLYVDAELFANPAWDIMLTLFLGDRDGVPVSRASLAAGNRLSDEACAAALDTLGERGLVEVPDAGDNDAPQPISLTQSGRQRMLAFLRSAARD